MPNLIMVLPLYNEGANLHLLFRSLETAFQALSLLGYQWRYVIVDDGSTDDTPRIIADLEKRLPMTVIRHKHNQGLGVAIRDGLRNASAAAANDDVVFTMDADNTHPAELISPMAQLVQDGNDVVIASRYRPGSRVVGVSRLRASMSWGARMLFQLLFKIRNVRDYTCGYRAYHARVLKEAFEVYGNGFIEHSGFQSTADILLKLSRLRIRMIEVPMILRYDRKKGISKMRVAKTVLQTIILLLQRRFERAPWKMRRHPTRGAGE